MLSDIGHITGQKYLHKYLEHEAEPNRLHSIYFGSKEFLEKLGLEENKNTQYEECVNLGKGFHPIKGEEEKLTSNAGSEDRREGYTTSLSPCKDFSAMLEVADEEGRNQLNDIDEQAVKATLQYMQDNFIFARSSEENKTTHDRTSIEDLFKKPEFKEIIIGRAFELNEAARTTIADSAKIYEQASLKEVLGEAVNKYNLGTDFQGSFKLPIQLTSKNIESINKRIKTLEKQYEKKLNGTAKDKDWACKKIHNAINGSIQYNSHFNDVCVKDIKENFYADKKELVEAGLKASEEEQQKGRGTNIKSMIASLHFHHTNRNGEPQKHTHLNFYNAVQDKNGEIKCMNFEQVYKHKKEIGIFYQAKLAELLNERGIATEKDKNSFKILGLPSELVKEFSKRTEEINKLADERLQKLSQEQGYNITPELRHSVRKQITDELRKKKDKTPLAELREGWMKQAEALGYGRAEANAWLNNSQKQIDEATKNHLMFFPVTDEKGSYLTKEFLAIIKQTSNFLTLADAAPSKLAINQKELNLQLQACKLIYPKLDIKQTIQQLEKIGYLKKDGKMFVRNQEMIKEFKDFNKQLYKEQFKKSHKQRDFNQNRKSRGSFKELVSRERAIKGLPHQEHSQAQQPKQAAIKGKGPSAALSALRGIKLSKPSNSPSSSSSQQQSSQAPEASSTQKGNTSGLSGPEKLKTEALLMKQQMHALAAQAMRSTGKQMQELYSQAGALGMQADLLFAQAEEMLQKQIGR